MNLSKISYTSVNADAWDVCGIYKHLLLTEFEVHTVRCGPSFFPADLWSKPKRPGHNQGGKKRGSVTYNTDRSLSGAREKKGN